MATSRPRNRRLDRVTDSPVRRSPRLSSRYSLLPSDSAHPLTSYPVTSRPSLSGYGRGYQHKEPEANILNESGQSVPPSYEDRGGSKQSSFGDRRMGDVDMPQHLFGLDESDNESTTSSDVPEDTLSYPAFETSRVYTPVKQRPAPQAQGIVPRIYAFFSSVLYKCGSLLYLAATGILCLDVVLLHKLFNFGGRSPTRSLAHMLYLPFVLALVVLFLVGGGLISGPSQPGDVDMNVVLRRVTNHVQNELSMFKTSFRSDVENHMERFVNLTIQLSERRINMSVEEQLLLKDQLLRQYSEDLSTELESLLSARLSDLEEHLSSLEASLRDIARDVTIDQLNTARNEWLTEIKQEIGANISSSVDNLREELLLALDDRDNTLTEQINSLSVRTGSLRTDLQATQDELTGTSNEVSVLKTKMESHDAQIAILQRKQQEILDEIAQIKNSTLARIDALEAEAQDFLDSREAINIFNEELDKNLANQTSSLREWLSNNNLTKEVMEDFETRLKELENLHHDSPTGGLSRSDVEEVISTSLERYSADKIGKFDFALENSGGSVLLDKCSPTYSQSLASVSLFGIPLWRVSGSPKLIIQPQVYPGDCWAFNGTSGYATVKLNDKISITEVSIEHIPKGLSPNGSLISAPQNFTVLGLSSPDDLEGTTLGTFTYNISGPSIQQFEVQEARDTFQFVRFNFLSNYGNPAYTCVYRVRVHGHYPDE